MYVPHFTLFFGLSAIFISAMVLPPNPADNRCSTVLWKHVPHSNQNRFISYKQHLEISFLFYFIASGCLALRLATLASWIKQVHATVLQSHSLKLLWEKKKTEVFLENCGQLSCLFIPRYLPFKIGNVTEKNYEDFAKMSVSVRVKIRNVSLKWQHPSCQCTWNVSELKKIGELTAPTPTNGHFLIYRLCRLLLDFG